jgi:Superinfection immunity protein
MTRRLAAQIDFPRPSAMGADMLKVLLEVLAAFAATGLYLLPAILADRTKRRSVLLLALFNLLFGWTVIGWFAALYWAFHPDSARKLGRVAKKNRRRSAQNTIDAIVSRARSRGARGAGVGFAHRVEHRRSGN